MFIMFVPDLGELAYCSGDAVVLSKEVAVVAPEGEAADLPISCGVEACIKIYGNWTKHSFRKDNPNSYPTDAEYQTTRS